jgi:hypothetical protein
MSEIIHNQIPDDEGNLIPASVHEGSAEISGARGENEHILVAMDSGVYNIRKATCNFFCETCNGFVSTETAIDPAPWATTVSGTSQLTFTMTYNTGSQYNLNSQSTWSSSNTGVSTVSTGLVRGVSAGSATVTAQSNVTEPVSVGTLCQRNALPPCPTQAPGGSGGGTVGPDHLSVVVDQQGYPAACPTTGVYLRQMEMQVVSADNQPIVVPTSVAEVYSGLTTNTCGNGQPIASACEAANSGQFIDSMAVSGNLCSSGINQSSRCGFSLTSTWSACGTSGNKTLWVSDRVTLSNEIEVDYSLLPWPSGTQCTSDGC